MTEKGWETKVREQGTEKKLFRSCHDTQTWNPAVGAQIEQHQSAEVWCLLCIITKPTMLPLHQSFL